MAGLKEELVKAEVVGIHTVCFIYYLEGGKWADALKENLFAPLEGGEFRAVVSTLLTTELLVRPKSLGREDVCRKYIGLIYSFPNLEVVPFDLDIAVRCAEIRAKYRIRTPDAVHLATAAEKGARVFVTNDAGLPPQVDNVKTVVLKDYLYDQIS